MWIFRRLPIFALIFVISSCGNTDNNNDTGTKQKANESVTISLENDLVLGDSSDVVFFGEISGVDVDDQERIYVADREASTIRVFSKKGHLLESIGASGRGPGEFSGLKDVHIRRDTLFAYDSRLKRLSAFGVVESFQFKYDINPAGCSSGLNSWIGPVEGGHLVLCGVARTPAQVKTGSNNLTVHRASNEGIVSDKPLLRVPSREFIYQVSGGSVTVTTKPFGREPVFRVGHSGEVFYYGWSDSLSIDVYSINGDKIRNTSKSFDTLNVTDEDIENKAGSKRGIYKELTAEADLPSSWPAFSNFVVGSKGTLWVQVNASRDKSVFWVFNENGEHTSTASLPTEVRLEAVQESYVYGVTSGSKGNPLVIRYRKTSPTSHHKD